MRVQVRGFPCAFGAQNHTVIRAPNCTTTIHLLVLQNISTSICVIICNQHSKYSIILAYTLFWFVIWSMGESIENMFNIDLHFRNSELDKLFFKRFNYRHHPYSYNHSPVVMV